MARAHQLLIHDGRLLHLEQLGAWGIPPPIEDRGRLRKELRTARAILTDPWHARRNADLTTAIIWRVVNRDQKGSAMISRHGGDDRRAVVDEAGPLTRWLSWVGADPPRRRDRRADRAERGGPGRVGAWPSASNTGCAPPNRTAWRRWPGIEWRSSRASTT